MYLDIADPRCCSGLTFLMGGVGRCAVFRDSFTDFAYIASGAQCLACAEASSRSATSCMILDGVLDATEYQVAVNGAGDLQLACITTWFFEGV